MQTNIFSNSQNTSRLDDLFHLRIAVLQHPTHGTIEGLHETKHLCRTSMDRLGKHPGYSILTTPRCCLYCWFSEEWESVLYLVQCLKQKETTESKTCCIGDSLIESVGVVDDVGVGCLPCTATFSNMVCTGYGFRVRLGVLALGVQFPGCYRRVEKRAYWSSRSRRRRWSAVQKGYVKRDFLHSLAYLLQVVGTAAFTCHWFIQRASLETMTTIRAIVFSMYSREAEFRGVVSGYCFQNGFSGGGVCAQSCVKWEEN